MALKSPVQLHNFWGATFATSLALPNAAGNPSGPPLNLEAGDFAYVIGTSSFWLCTSPGTSGVGDAVWVQIPTGAGATDHFGPRWVVGNELAGDPNVAQLGAFRYVPDPGDGTGIATALTEATAAGRGDILVRSGVYTLPSGTATYQIPPNVTLRGAGWETIIVGADDQRAVFRVEQGGTLADLKITMPAPTEAPTGDLVVELAGSSTGNATAQNVYVDASLGEALGTLDSLIGGIGSLADPEGGSIGARALDCVVAGNVYNFSNPPTPPVREFSCFSFPDADQSIIRGQGYFGDYLLDLSGTSSRCIVDLQGENFRTAKISGLWHQLRITSITFFTEFDVSVTPFAVQFIGASRCSGTIILVGSDALGVTTAMTMDAASVGNRVSLTCETYQTGATIDGAQNVLSGIAVEATGAAPLGGTTGIDFTATSTNNVLIGGVLNAATPIVDNGTLNEIAHTV